MYSHQSFAIGIRLTLASYVDYVMTETNIAAAVRRGLDPAAIKAWCTETLTPLWTVFEMEVLFRGYFACMTPALGAPRNSSS